MIQWQNSFMVGFSYLLFFLEFFSFFHLNSLDCNSCQTKNFQVLSFLISVCSKFEIVALSFLSKSKMIVHFLFRKMSSTLVCQCHAIVYWMKHFKFIMLFIKEKIRYTSKLHTLPKLRKLKNYFYIKKQLKCLWNHYIICWNIKYFKVEGVMASQITS